MYDVVDVIIVSDQLIWNRIKFVFYGIFFFYGLLHSVSMSPQQLYTCVFGVWHKYIRCLRRFCQSGYQIKS